MEGLLEYKSIRGEVKDLDPKRRIITGYLSAFGNEDDVGDIVIQGAFAKSIKERHAKIFFLNQHNWSQPHGKFSTLMEDAKGLYFESMPLPDTSYSNDAFKLYQAGILNEHSIGYQVLQDDFDSEGRRLLKEIKLYEGSNVTLGANAETPFTGFKTSIKEINDQTKRILKAVRTGDFTDETMILLEVALKQLQKDAFELGKETLTRPDESTLIEPIELIKEFNKQFELK